MTPHIIISMTHPYYIISLLCFNNNSLYYILQHGLEWVLVLLLFHLPKAGSFKWVELFKNFTFLEKGVKKKIKYQSYFVSWWIFVLAVWRLLVSLFCSWWWGQLLCPLIASALEVPLILALDSCYFFCDIEFFHYWT